MAVEVGWLCLGGIELINDARVLSYLHNGLAGANIAASIGVDTSGVYTGMVEAPYADTYSDAYGEPSSVNCGENFEPVCLECACPALVIGESYVDPATDDAPWWQASSPCSVEFLGATALSIEVLPATDRAQRPRTRFGGTPSPQRLLPRIMQVTARLFASSPAGLEWGKRWFYDVLAGACDGSADAVFLPFCPADQFDQTPYRMLADTVLVDGPTMSDPGRFSGFRAVDVRFQLGSSSPWLLGYPVECATGRVSPGATLSCLIETDAWGGGQALRVTLEDGDFNDVTVRAVPLAADQDCEDAATGMPCSEFTVQGAQDGDVLVVDSARRAALLTDISSKLDVSAISYLVFDGPFHWIEAPPCTRLCVQVRNDGVGAPNVTIETVVREL